MSMCPLLPGEQCKKYNSLVNDAAQLTIFLVQHSNQAYPADILIYQT